MTKKYQIAVNAAFRESTLTYESELDLSRGDLVLVPLGKREEKGCVLCEVQEYESKYQLKSVKEKSEDFKINEELLKLFEWMSQYYHYPIGRLIFDTLPKFLKRPRELKFEQGQDLGLDFELTEKQKTIFESLKTQITFTKSLLKGVTGSGKTAIYLKLIREMNQRGKSVLFLLPEINLTPQFIQNFSKVLGVKIYSYNSAISNSDRFGLWKLLLEDDDPKVIIGVRSSIFLPVKNLGLIIVDEEHDGSFKQDDRCSYHGRDVAIKRASLLNIPILLGSATPSLESLNQAMNSNHLYELKERVSGARLPDIHMVDLRTEEDVEELWPITRSSISLIERALGKGEQVLVFVNRLGFASYVQCRSCGHQFFCLNCSVPLKYFRKKNQLHCQQCDLKVEYPKECPECGNMNLLQKGFGTEKIADVLRTYFQDKRVERFDRDEVKTMSQLEDMLNDFHDHKIDIMVGTQMLSKGHNFKKVNLVLILGTDNQLSYPDFRSQEKVFQLVSQVSGRAGRYSNEGKVIIQSLLPDLPVYQSIVNGKEDEFIQSELELRKDTEYPPFTKIVVLYITTRFQNRLGPEAMNIGNLLQVLQEKYFKNVEVYGPMPTMIEKRSNQFTWQIVFKTSNLNELHNLISTFEKEYKVPSSFTLKFDIDPQIFS